MHARVLRFAAFTLAVAVLAMSRTGGGGADARRALDRVRALRSRNDAGVGADDARVLVPSSFDAAALVGLKCGDSYCTPQAPCCCKPPDEASAAAPRSVERCVKPADCTGTLLPAGHHKCPAGAALEAAKAAATAAATAAAAKASADNKKEAGDDDTPAKPNTLVALATRLRNEKLLDKLFFQRSKESADFFLASTGKIAGHYQEAWALFDNAKVPDGVRCPNGAYPGEQTTTSRLLKDKLIALHGKYMVHFGYGVTRFYTAAGAFTLYGALSNVPDGGDADGQEHTEVSLVHGANEFRAALVRAGLPPTKIKMLLAVSFPVCDGCQRAVGLVSTGESWLETNAAYHASMWCPPLQTNPKEEGYNHVDAPKHKKRKLSRPETNELKAQGEVIFGTKPDLTSDKKSAK